MGRDNKDRYGYRHRSDDDHDVGDPAPGRVGDSDGTFHDRARKNEHVIKGDQVQHNSGTAYAGSAKHGKNDRVGSGSSDGESNSISQKEAVDRTVTVTPHAYGGTETTLVKWKNHQIHIKGGTPGEEMTVKLEPGEGFLIGKPVQVKN